MDGLISVTGQTAMESCVKSPIVPNTGHWATASLHHTGSGCSDGSPLNMNVRQHWEVCSKVSVGLIIVGSGATD